MSRIDLFDTLMFLYYIMATVLHISVQMIKGSKYLIVVQFHLSGYKSFICLQLLR